MAEPTQDPELIAEFLHEAEEHLDQIDAALLELERRPATAGLSEAMGALHSLKGSAGYLNLVQIQDLCHSGEELLASADTLAREVRAARVDQALDVVSELRAQLEQLRPRRRG